MKGINVFVSNGYVYSMFINKDFNCKYKDKHVNSRENELKFSSVFTLCDYLKNKVKNITLLNAL